MKAIIVREFGIPEVMKYEDAEIPEPGSGQLLVRIRAIGVNPVETYIRSGNYAVKPLLPYTPGTDSAGIVEATGDGVGPFKPGDRVYTSGSVTGTYAEFAVCNKEDVHPLPERASFAQGAALGIPYATAYRALFIKAGAKPGETILVHGGTGGVGIAAVQLAKNAGMTVIATGGTERGRALLSAQGTGYVLDHRDEGYIAKVKEITSGRGADVILEMLANENLANDTSVIARNGRIIVIGNRGKIQIDPRTLMANDVTVTGMVLRNADRGELASIHAALIAGLSEGSLSPVIGREFSLIEAVQAHRSIMEPGAHGKIVLVP